MTVTITTRKIRRPKRAKIRRIVKHGALFAKRTSDGKIKRPKDTHQRRVEQGVKVRRKK